MKNKEYKINSKEDFENAIEKIGEIIKIKKNIRKNK
jgi:hypothetical protein